VPGGAQIGAVKGSLLYGTVPSTSPATLFSLSTKGKYTLLHSFNAGTDGSTPNARLALDPFGNLYGTAPSGGVNDGGTLWEYSASGVFSTPHPFGGANDGGDPMQGPTLGLHNDLLGTTAMGAPNNNGILFNMAHHGAYKIMYNFLSDNDGHCPFSGVAVGKSGAVYGTTVGMGYGGNPNGSVWKFTKSGGLQTIYKFQNGNDGEWPYQAPVVDSAGNVYGTTFIQNGTNFPGAIWMISAKGVFSVLYDFTGGTDGYYPNSPLLIDSDGKLYGTTRSGGADNYGTVFSITPSGTFTLVHGFANNGDGGQPTGNLVAAKDGTIYGGTAYGPVFKIVP
jgi:uncharacterized repeat protein (TIGR03803 family)